MSAFRYARDCGDGTPYTMAENLQRNSSLLSKLRASRFGVTSIKGIFIENYGAANAREVAENSFFVVDLQDRGDMLSILRNFAEEFEQDSIIFGEAGKNSRVIGTNQCPNGYPGYGKEIVHAGAIFGETGKFMSRVHGRPFIFADKPVLESHGVAKYPTELRGPVEQSTWHWSKF